MRRSLLVAWLLVALAAAAPAEASKRVVGGSDVAAGKFGFVANISIAGAASCTGTLIAPGWVMTAGHCGTPGGLAGAANPVPFPGSAYTVTLGTVRTDGEGGEVHEVKMDGVHIAPGYFFTNGQGSDVTLLELTEPSAIEPMRIAAADERTSWEPGDVMTVAGFGVTESGGDPPEVLQQVEVPVVADATCAMAYTDPTPIFGDEFDPATEVCAGLPEGGKDSCQGDSGGPLMAPVEGGLRLVGATSRGTGCAEPGFPGIYARVAEGSLREFVAGLVPEAFEKEGTANTAPAPQPGEPSTEGCSPRSIAIPGGLRKLRIRVNGRTVLNRRGNPSAFRFPLTLSPGATTRVRVFTRSADGKRRVNTRIYDGCRRTSSRTQAKP